MANKPNNPFLMEISEEQVEALRAAGLDNFVVIKRYMHIANSSVGDSHPANETKEDGKVWVPAPEGQGGYVPKVAITPPRRRATRRNGMRTRTIMKGHMIELGRSANAYLNRTGKHQGRGRSLKLAKLCHNIIDASPSKAILMDVLVALVIKNMGADFGYPRYVWGELSNLARKHILRVKE